MKDSASKLKQDNAADIILGKKDNKQGNLEGLSSLLYTPIKVYRTAVLGCRDRLRVGTKGWIGMHSVLYYWLILNRNV